MSITAEIWDVTRDEDGVKLWLAECQRPHPDPAGQSRLLVIGDCRCAELLVGHEIWAAGSGPIMLGETEIGKRVGSTRCLLWNHGIREALGLECDNLN